MVKIVNGDNGYVAQVTKNRQLLTAGISCETVKCTCPNCNCGGEYYNIFTLEDWYKKELKQLFHEVLDERK